jgi:hypothetical protein
VCGFKTTHPSRFSSSIFPPFVFAAEGDDFAGRIGFGIPPVTALAVVPSSPTKNILEYFDEVG